jgi:hypothetical protein
VPLRTGQKHLKHKIWQMHREGVQRATAKPSGRAHRHETLAFTASLQRNFARFGERPGLCDRPGPSRRIKTSVLVKIIFKCCYPGFEFPHFFMGELQKQFPLFPPCSKTYFCNSPFFFFIQNSEFGIANSGFVMYNEIYV